MWIGKGSRLFFAAEDNEKLFVLHLIAVISLKAQSGGNSYADMICIKQAAGDVQMIHIDCRSFPS